MLERFIVAAFHPNRAVEILNTLGLFDKIGLSGYLYRINELVESEAGGEASVIAFNIDNLIGNGLTEALGNFGVSIEYSPNEISLVTDLLQFLALWDTAEGFNPSLLDNVEDLNELGATAEDILIELFEISGGNPDQRLIDWIMRVSPALIARIDDSIKRYRLQADESSGTSAEQLSQLKVFAAHYPDSKMVAYVRAGGALGVSVSTLILENEDMLLGLSDKDMAVELVAMAIISNLPRETLTQAFIELIEPVVGTSLKGQTIVREINTVFAKVLTHEQRR